MAEWLSCLRQFRGAFSRFSHRIGADLQHLNGLFRVILVTIRPCRPHFWATDLRKTAENAVMAVPYRQREFEIPEAAHWALAGSTPAAALGFTFCTQNRVTPYSLAA